MKKILGAAVLLLALCAPASSQFAAGISPCSANTISVSGSSNNVQLSLCGPSVLLWNVGTQELFYVTGTASGTAATTSNYSLPGNSFIVINVGNGSAIAPYLAAITATSTTTLRITQGYAE
jgi:hypothetical protein